MPDPRRIDTVWILLRIEGEAEIHNRVFLDREKIYKLFNDPGMPLSVFMKQLLPPGATANDLPIVAKNSKDKSFDPDTSRAENDQSA